MVEIAIVDDERNLADSLKLEISEMGHQVKTFYTAQPFLDYIEISEPDLVILDLQLPDIHGMEVLHSIKLNLKSTLVIIMTAHGDMESVLQALKGGAYDYLNKPFELEEIRITIDRALSENRLLREVEHHRKQSATSCSLKDFIGESEPIKKLHQTVVKLADIDSTTVFLRGESGTGKNLIAKAIHNLSSLSNRQFIAVNCAAIPENLLESELFGYEKGAFTDAKKRKIGLIELANGGTLFLDEIGDVPLSMQVKLLSFLESKEFRRVGGSTEIKANALVISATNLDLDDAIEKKKFRQDLYYRLNVLPIKIPPLRERADDILLLTNYYIKRFSKKFRKPLIKLGPDAEKAFLRYRWPGNVRELKNLIERFIILSTIPEVTFDDLPTVMKECLLQRGSEASSEVIPELNFEEKLVAYERNLIGNALEKAAGVKTEAAASLGISRYSLMRKMNRLFKEQDDL